jgi:ACS family D-galactonate transporter-like MFS transporter
MDTNVPAASGRAKADAGHRVRWRIVGLLFVIYTINCIDRMSLSVGLPLISKEFALSATIQGLILSAFFWTYSGCQIPGGWLVDRFGARRVLTVATVVWGGFQALAAAATSGVMLLLTRVGLGVFEAPFMPGASKLTAAWLPPNERSRGVTLIDSGAPLGSALGGLIISGLIIFLGSWRLAFLTMGVLTVVFGVVLWIVIRNRPREHAAVGEAELAVIEGTAAVAQPKPRPMSSRTFLAMVFGRIGWAMIFFGFVTWGPNYLAAARGMDIKGLGLSTFAIFLAGTVGEIASGILADRLQRNFSRDVSFKILFGISGVMSLGCLLYLPYVANPIAAVCVLCVAVLFHLFGGLYWSIPAMLAPAERIGLVGGVMNFAGTSSGISVPIIVGLLVDHTGGFDAVLQFFAACALVYLVGSLLIDFRPAPVTEEVK